MRIIKAIIKGCGYMPDYGSHPGTMPLIVFILLGVIVGIRADESLWIGALRGGGFIGIWLLPLYFFGAYSRGKDHV